jgi:hypothetical protein
VDRYEQQIVDVSPRGSLAQLFSVGQKYGVSSIMAIPFRWIYERAEYFQGKPVLKPPFHSFIDKFCRNMMHVRCWMKTIPEDVIIWVGNWV